MRNQIRDHDDAKKQRVQRKWRAVSERHETLMGEMEESIYQSFIGCPLTEPSIVLDYYKVTRELYRCNKRSNAFPGRSLWAQWPEPLHENILQGRQHFYCSIPHLALSGQARYVAQMPEISTALNECNSSSNSVLSKLFRQSRFGTSPSY